LRGTLGSACPQPVPNATERPHLSESRAAQRRRRRRWWRGEEGARRPGPEGKAPRNALSATSCAVSCAASFTCSSLAHRPRTIVWGGTRVLGMGSAAGRCRWRKQTPSSSCPLRAQHALRHVLRQALRRDLHVLVLHVSPKGSAGVFTYSFFTCRPRASVGGGTRVFGVGSAAGRWRVPRRAPSRPRPPQRPERLTPRLVSRPAPRPAPCPSRAFT